jgi:hypothetical protein
MHHAKAISILKQQMKEENINIREADIIKTFGSQKPSQ